MAVFVLQARGTSALRAGRSCANAFQTIRRNAHDKIFSELSPPIILQDADSELGTRPVHVNNHGPVSDHAFSVAPMMDYTDRHFRYLLRLLSSKAVLYTEMVGASTLVHNPDIDRWLRLSDDVENPVVLQLGGSDCEDLRTSVKRASAYNYDEINLNCGCPSDKVAGKGSFGATLMLDAKRVGQLCDAMAQECGKPITVKCRIGVDDQDSYEQLAEFVGTVSQTGGVEHFIVHARKAILGGLSPEENRRIPPIKYDHVYQLVADFPSLRFSMNGEVKTYEDVSEHLSRGLHGVMVGRSVIEQPWLWSEVDSRIYGLASDNVPSRRKVLEAYADYAEQEISRMLIKDPKYAPRLKRAILRHTANLFRGEPNGRKFRVVLDQQLNTPGRSPHEILQTASGALFPETLDAGPGMKIRDTFGESISARA